MRSYWSIKAVLASAVLAVAVPAQGRTHFTYHLQVDPTNGDDMVARLQNPVVPLGIPTAPYPLQTHPSVPAPAGGILQQAPYAYRTVTEALLWFNTLPVIAGTDQKRLPWTAPNGMVMDYVVIHCLPGLYGPRRTDLPTEEYEPLSGLPWNGETFPLRIPGGVSIQGTSALDTIFDARRYEPNLPPTWTPVSVFWIGGGFAQGLVPQDFSGTFIDAVTIRGARGGAWTDGCGVLIHDEAPVKATVGNCMIYNNTIGIAVLREDFFLQTVHNPRIINNTVAWNEVGLWNGTRFGDPELDTQNLLVLLNNIFDCSGPLVGQLTNPAVPEVPAYAATVFVAPANMHGISCFEGVHQNDVTVASKPNCSQAPGNYNAYEFASPIPRFNIGAGYGGWTWPVTPPRPGWNRALMQPRVDLFAFTMSLPVYGFPAVSRGDIYVNDVFRNDPAWAGNPPLPPAQPRPSQHDFRIAPMARQSGSSNSQLSPLVNVGIDLIGAAAMQITMANGEIVSPTWIPGLPPNAEDVATLHVWDWDSNGYANPRVQSHVGFTNGTPCVGNVDLGASELGDTLVSGFVDSTRIFSRAHAAVAAQTALLGNQARRDLLYFFNVYPGPFAGIGLPGYYLRPQFNLAIDWKRTPATPKPGTQSEWYPQLALGNGPVPGNPYDPLGVTNYTDGDWQSGSPSTRRDLVRDPLNVQAVDFPKFMRNLVCDLAPHLYHAIQPNMSTPDQSTWRIFYPEWPFQYGGSPITNQDLFHCDPWYDQPLFALAAPNDNLRVYYDATKPLRLGMVSPPKTVIPLDVRNRLMPPPAPLSVSYLFWNPAHGIGTWDFAAPLDSLYQVNQRGWGDVHKPPAGFTGGEIVPYVPGQDWQGIRINMELSDPDNAGWAALGFQNNLPTFLIVQGDGVDAPPLDLAEEQQMQRSVLAPRASMLPGDSIRLEYDSVAHRRVQEAFKKLRGSK